MCIVLMTILRSVVGKSVFQGMAYMAAIHSFLNSDDFYTFFIISPFIPHVSKMMYQRQSRIPNTHNTHTIKKYKIMAQGNKKLGPAKKSAGQKKKIPHQIQKSNQRS